MLAAERDAAFAEVERLAKVGSWIWNVSSNEVFWSPELYRILGHDRGVPASVEAFFAALHPDDRETVRSRSQVTARSGDTTPARCRVLLADGSVRHIVITGSAIRDEHGNVAHLVGAVRDISEFVASEEKLRATADLLAEAETIAGIGSFTWDLESGRVRWSETTAQIVGVDTSSRGATSRLLERIHPDDRALVDEFRSQLARGVAPTPLELRVLRPDGSLRYMALNARIQPGRGAGFVVGTLQDVTAQRLLEQQLRHSQKMEAVGRLAGGIAHDFNNYLVVIRGNLDLLRAALAHSPELETLDEIAHASDRCATLTRQLLAFARKHPVEPRLVDPAQIVVESASMLKRIVGDSVELQVEAASDVGLILADPSQVELVILNLAVNARDAMPAGGRLFISVSKNGADPELSKLQPTLSSGFVKIEVRDTGLGIPENLKPRVFEPFFTTKMHGHGTGLGLATAYGIVQQAGGHIELTSELGRGTTFRVYFPIRSGGKSRSERAREAAPQASGELVLLAEDEPGVRRLTRRLLERGGYRVVDAENGVMALEIAEKLEDIHLLLTDITMPKMDGITLARRMRLQRPGLRVLLMSGYPDPDGHGLAEREFETAILTKPFTLDQLLAAVRAAITERQ